MIGRNGLGEKWERSEKKRFEKRKVNGMEKTRGMERREEKRKNIF